MSFDTTTGLMTFASQDHLNGIYPAWTYTLTITAFAGTALDITA